MMNSNGMVKNKSLKKALDILDCFAEKQPLGVTEIAEKLELNKSNVYDILQTFIAAEYLAQDEESGKYYLGLGLLKLSRAVGNRYNFHDVAVNYMKILSEETDETIYLTVPIQRRVYYLDAIRPPKGRFLTSTMRADTDYMHCTSCGKAMMAYMPKTFLDEYYQKSVIKLTDKTITDKEQLRAELKKIRERGYAIDNEENEPNLRCVGVAILSHTGTVAGAMSISGKVEDMPFERIESLAEELKVYARLIGAYL